MATSGDYERGEHIRDPRNGMAALGARSVSVIGPDGGLADALATAVMVDGIDAQRWVVREELREYSFYVINRHEGTAWLYGPMTLTDFAPSAAMPLRGSRICSPRS